MLPWPSQHVSPDTSKQQLIVLEQAVYEQAQTRIMRCNLNVYLPNALIFPRKKWKRRVRVELRLLESMDVKIPKKHSIRSYSRRKQK